MRFRVTHSLFSFYTRTSTEFGTHIAPWSQFHILNINATRSPAFHARSVRFGETQATFFICIRKGRREKRMNRRRKVKCLCTCVRVNGKNSEVGEETDLRLESRKISRFFICKKIRRRRESFSFLLEIGFLLPLFILTSFPSCPPPFFPQISKLC